MRAVHALSEQANQTVLSVKGGAGGLDYDEFRKHILAKLRWGRPLETENLLPPLKEFVDRPGMLAACETIRRGVRDGVPGWQRFLFKAVELRKIIDGAGGTLEFPLNDARVRPFLSAT